MKCMIYVLNSSIFWRICWTHNCSVFWRIRFLQNIECLGIPNIKGLDFLICEGRFKEHNSLVCLILRPSIFWRNPIHQKTKPLLVHQNLFKDFITECMYYRCSTESCITSVTQQNTTHVLDMCHTCNRDIAIVKKLKQ